MILTLCILIKMKMPFADMSGGIPGSAVLCDCDDSVPPRK